MNSDERLALSLAGLLRQHRLDRGDRQVDMATRLEIGLSTYKKMEGGDTDIAFRYWLRAWNFLGMGEKVIAAMQPEEDLVAEFDRHLLVQASKRQRVRRR